MAMKLVGVAGCAIALAGCDLAPAYTPPAVTMPNAFKEDVVAKPGKHAKSGPWHGAARRRRAARPVVGSLRRSRVEPAGGPGRRRQPDARRHRCRLRSGPRVRARGGGRPLPHGRSSAAPYRRTNNRHRRPLRSANQPTYYGANTIDAQAELRSRRLGPGPRFRGRGQGISAGERRGSGSAPPEPACGTRRTTT